MRAPKNMYVIKRKSPIHGWGIFAKVDIPKGVRIIEYVGEKITKAESDRRGPMHMKYAARNKEKGAVYLFELNKHYDIDGHVAYNTAKYINHSCTPNCEVDIIRGRIWVSSVKAIKKGQELFYNYGYDVEEYEDHLCCCGTARCVGHITAEEHWPKLKRLKAKKNA